MAGLPLYPTDHVAKTNRLSTTSCSDTPATRFTLCFPSHLLHHHSFDSLPSIHHGRQHSILQTTTKRRSTHPNNLSILIPSRAITPQWHPTPRRHRGKSLPPVTPPRWAFTRVTRRRRDIPLLPPTRRGRACRTMALRE